MAVKRMKKLSIICQKTAQEQILRLAQELQQIEVENIFEDEGNQEWLAEYFSESRQQTTDRSPLENSVRHIQEAIRFIRDNGSAKEKITELKRRDTGLSEFEQSFDQSQLEAELSRIDDLKARWETNLSATRQFQEQEDWATDWQSLDIATESPRLKTTALLTGTVPNEQWDAFSEKVSSYPAVYLEFVAAKAKETAFALVFLRSEGNKIHQLLQDFGGRVENPPYQGKPKQILADAKSQLDSLTAERKQLTKEIGEKKLLVADLQKAEEILLTRVERENARVGIIQSQYLAVIRGWIAEKDILSLEKRMAKAFPDNQVYLSFEDPTAEEVAANKTPTKLENGKLVAPFEMLTEMYSIPRYDEIDPTPWMMPFYLVFFGMMVADLGYGLLMLLVTTVALKAVVLPKGTRRFMKLFQYLSVSTIAWGLIYGSCFGVEMPVYLLSPSKDFMAIFGLSMVFGGIQIFTGLFLAGKENLKKKDYLAAVNQGFSWQGILAGILIAAAGALVLKSDTVTILGAILAIVCALAVLVTSTLSAESKVGGFFMGLYDLYGITSYIGDFVSYSRLMALGISGGSIAAAFNMLVGYMPPAARFTAGVVLIVILQGLNIFLSLLSAYVHAARLQYVEFFGKFYSGGGRAFKPLKPAEKYMNFIDENGGKE